MHFSPFLCQQSAGHSLLPPGGVCSTPGTHCPRGGNTVPPFAMDWSRLHWKRMRLWNLCSTLITSLNGGIQLGEFLRKERGSFRFSRKLFFSIKPSKVQGPAQEMQFLGVKWRDGRCQIPTDVIKTIPAVSPPTSKKERQVFLGAMGFWRMHIAEYSQNVSPLYLATWKKNDFHWGPEQQ